MPLIAVMDQPVAEADIAAVRAYLASNSLTCHLSRAGDQTCIGIIGNQFPPTLSVELGRFSGVHHISAPAAPYLLASREFRSQDTLVQVRGVTVGGTACVVIAGPCSVESQAQLMEVAWAAREAGASMLRGGAFKPRTSPYSFRGLGEQALEWLARAREETGLPIVTEVMSPSDVALVSRYADILQIGARNMQNYQLLEEAGRTGMPVLLKRGLAATIEEWLLAAEYVLAQGNPKVILCERGIRTFEPATRNTLDLNAVALVKQLSHLPVIADPSHGTGRRALVAPMALAAVAAGADGVMIEAHPDPDRARSDGDQSLDCDALAALMPRLAAVAAVMGRRLANAYDNGRGASVADALMLAHQLTSLSPRARVPAT